MRHFNMTSFRSAHCVILKSEKIPGNFFFWQTCVETIGHLTGLEPALQTMRQHKTPPRISKMPLREQHCPHWEVDTIQLSSLSFRFREHTEVQWLHSQQVTDGDTAGFIITTRAHARTPTGAGARAPSSSPLLSFLFRDQNFHPCPL